jgi:uncharacterized membrane protein YcjF (UPF0283 family)
MDKIELVFAWAVTVLAAVAAVGALVVMIVWEFYAIRRTIQRHRRPTHQEALWAEHATMTHPMAGPKR